MKIGSQIINGFFEYHDQLEFTEGDLVIHSNINSDGDQVRRIFYVKSNVIGINPFKDLQNIYYDDYFLKVYGSQNVLTKSSVQTFINNLFTGINSNGIFEPQEINLSDVTNLNNSGIWKIADSDRHVVVYKCLETSFMIISGLEYLALRLGTLDGSGNISWESLIDVSSNMNSLATEYLNKLNSLEILLRNKIKEVHDVMNALTQVFSDEYSEIFNLNTIEENENN